ncbi:AraC family transcriptional regulator [Paenibacillus sp. L3-i20]|uniref:AraC family transcriptional regulator n=1 Tax=Paenibacillus sp. L3-i20 TaxID=2905833 RepID=UPI001EDCB92B|nr:AraC family transcriptional regulator [Paenibacillus sp. L3-i20]GKU80019.1 hypothetical protein L3i20_v244160 [Paenibacillus sp. L3-i20]
MKYDEQIALWNHTAVKVFDIRRSVMNSGQWLEYRFPASGFIYGVRGLANLVLDGHVHRIERYYVLHGAKGMSMMIEAEEEFEFYLLFYRAKLAFSGWRELRQLLDRKSPFEGHFGFEPEEPRTMLLLMSSMEQTLNSLGSYGSVEIKGLFYQFVHEVLRHQYIIRTGNGQADLVTLVIRYIHNHYHEGITLDYLANRFNYSPRYLSTKFKQQTGYSPIEYLIQYRIKQSKQLLLETGTTLRVVAEHVGYSDEYYFSRLFKKQTGVSPTRYQLTMREKSASDNSPFAGAKLSIGGLRLRGYSLTGSDNHYQYYGGGFSNMNRNKKSSLILSTLLSLTLLLGACSGGGANVGSSASPSPSASAISATAATTSEAESKETTRTVSTVKGDVIVPADPKRVVVLYMLGDIVALGVDPVGISEIYDGAAFTEQLKDTQTLGHHDEVNPEAVLSLEPDLIIVSSEKGYNMLHKIAPTVLIPTDKVTTNERILKLGEVFGKEKEAQSLLNDFHGKVEESREKLRSSGVLDKTVTILEGGVKEMMIIESKEYGRGSQIVYDYLGMKAPEIIQAKVDVAKAAMSENVSMEVLPEFAGDILLRSSWEGMDDLSDNAIWSSIPAVKEGRVIEAEFGLFFYTDLFSLNSQLDYITNELLATASNK